MYTINNSGCHSCLTRPTSYFPNACYSMATHLNALLHRNVSIKFAFYVENKLFIGMQQHFTYFLVQTEVACYVGLFITNTNGKNNKMKLLYHGRIFQEPSSYIIFTARNSSCGKVMFSQACVILSVHRGGVTQHALGQGMWKTPSGQTPPPQTATEVGGTHATGMHSCV